MQTKNSNLRVLNTRKFDERLYEIAAEYLPPPDTLNENDHPVLRIALSQHGTEEREGHHIDGINRIDVQFFKKERMSERTGEYDHWWEDDGVFIMSTHDDEDGDEDQTSVKATQAVPPSESQPEKRKMVAVDATKRAIIRAEVLSISLVDVKGTGDDGVITEQDVHDHYNEMNREQYADDKGRGKDGDGTIGEWFE